MEKQTLFKMGILEQTFLTKALLEMKQNTGAEDCAGIEELVSKTVSAPKRKLYLNDTEYACAVESLNGMRNAYLSAGRSSGGIDRVLAKLMSSKYRNVPVR